MRGILRRNATSILHPVRPAWSDGRRAQYRVLSTSLRQRDDYHGARQSALQKTIPNTYPRLALCPTIASCQEFIGRYGSLEPSQSASEKDIQLCGRVTRIRFASSKLVFMDIEQAHRSIQILCSFKDFEGIIAKPDFKAAFHNLQRGDVVEAVGQPQRTPSGELSLRLHHLPRLLAPCLHPMPDRLADSETKMQKRHVDLRINRRLSSIVRTRAEIVQFIRNFLLADGHIEVQTPILADGASGAMARSFVTSATEFPNRNINLRIAPELWLKRLIAGGVDRVFEIGPVFRNEGLDLTHNPEFTTCEFYRSYTDLDKLIQMTENLLSGMALHIKSLQKSLDLSIQFPDTDFTGQYRRLDFIPEIESRAGCKLPDLSDPTAEAAIKALLLDKGIPHKQNLTLPQLLDRLCAHYLEPECEEPTWIINHPECLAPLAKSFVHPQTGQVVSARGEIFINGKELANTYEEENSPVEQRRKFEQQLAYRNDENEAVVDESYLEALEWGMPPTGGWGCGIDRLCMLMTGAARISDVLTFGSLRNVVSLTRP